MKHIQLKQKDIPIIREKLAKEQNHRCPICSRQIRKPVLDHSHKKRIKGTGLVRGVLCNQCNVFIAKSENNCIRFGNKISQLPNLLRAAADYLEKPHTNYIHPTERPAGKKLMKSSYNALKRAFVANPGRRKKFPEYPKSKKINKLLLELYNKYEIQPEYYK